MAKYIKQEMTDLQKTGEQKAFYRIKIERNIGTQEFIDRMCHPGSGISRGEATGFLIRAAKELREFACDKGSGITAMGRGITVVYVLS